MGALLDRLPSERLLLLAAAIGLTVVAYELARFAVVGALSSWLRVRVRAFVDTHRVRIDPFKLSGRAFVREQLVNDLEVQEAVVQAARAGEPIARARARVEEYVEEITPRFSLTAYFQFGYRVASACLRLVYRVEPRRETFERLQGLPPDASVMFLMNHRSNADYLLVAVALARRVAISFAIGEWARVFPVDHLFKLFGGYFLRRNFRDPLYHTVLRRYLQLIVRQGVTQGLFPEGRLSRDGRIAEPKIGLLDAMIAMAAEPDFHRPIVFVPVGLNFDRVLEDHILVAETKRGPPSRREQLRSMWRLLVVGPARLLAGAARLATGRLHRFGYASLAVGEPVSLDAFARSRGLTARTLAALPKEERRPLVKAFADEMMQRIAKVTPATPVPLTCAALLRLGGRAPHDALVREVALLSRRLRAADVPVVTGREFAHLDAERTALEEARRSEARRPELAALEGELLDHEAAEECVRIGLARLAERGLLLTEAGVVSVNESLRPLVRYYAASVADPEPLQDDGRITA